MYKLFLCCFSLSFLPLAVAETTTAPTTEQAPPPPDEDANNGSDNKNKSADSDIALTVVIDGIDDEAMRKNAEVFLSIYTDNGKKVKNPSYTDYLAQSGVEQIKQSLQPFGYYSAKVEMSADKKPKSWTITYRVDKGAPVIAKNVDIEILGEGKDFPEYQTLKADFAIKPGDILVQEKYKAFKGELTATATTYGYFDADFVRKEILIAEGYKNADIKLTYDTKNRYHFGETTIKQDFLDQDVFERFLTYQAGDPYSSTAIADVQRDLYNSNYVKTIDVTANPVKADQTVPVEFAITPKKNKKHTFTFGYGTDTGVRAKYDFDWRWVNRRGHSFNSEVYLTQDVQKAGVEYRIPADNPATDYYKMFANVDRDYSDDTESLMWNVGGAYHDQIGNWEREVGVKWQQENFTLGNDSGNIGLLTPFASLTYRKVDNPLRIAHGVRFRTEIAGAHESLLSDTSFLQAVASTRVIHKLSDKHKIRLAGAVGKTWVDDFHELPSAYRFFTGGDRTIRGYSYNNIGDRDSSNTNIGGDKMYYVSAEYEYFLNNDMALASFVDAGDAYADESDSLKVGAGVGFHYYSPIGPIRVDVAHGFDEDYGDDVRLHLNIGPEF